MSIKTLDVQKLAREVGNIYKAVAVSSKRARQISASIKNELQERLSYYDGFDRELEEKRMNEDQARVSMEYEKKLKPTVIALNELVNHELTYRMPEIVEDED
jgi:DNA-directed RNA polymerase subunit K/omega